MVPGNASIPKSSIPQFDLPFVTRSVPQLVALVAALVGVALFVATLYSLDLQETLASVRRLGRALPLVLAPGETVTREPFVWRDLVA